MSESESPFAVQKDVRAPWRRYLDELAPLRPELHRFCARLTGSAFEGEDLVQEALLRVFGQLGKLDADVAKLEHPRAYLVRTATRIWIDAQRRRGREQEILAEEARQEAAARSGDPARGAELPAQRLVGCGVLIVAIDVAQETGQFLERRGPLAAGFPEVEGQPAR